MTHPPSSIHLDLPDGRALIREGILFRFFMKRPHDELSLPIQTALNLYLDQMREFARSGAWSFGSTNGQSRFARAFDAAKGNTGFGRAASGNWAFEEYRNAELERLEARRRALQEESEAFAEFVEELKRAKDREQFDAFMAKRRAEGGGPTVQA